MEDRLDIPGLDIEESEVKSKIRTLAEYTQGTLHNSIINLPREYLDMSIEELREIAKPSKMDYIFRMNFWIEFQKCTNPKVGLNLIRVNHIYGDIHRDTFYYVIKNCPARVAFMIRPIREYEEELNNMMMVASDRLWEMVNLPIYKTNKKTGEKTIDTRVAEIVLKTISLLENRTKGMAVQRIANKTQVEHRKVESLEAETPQQLDSKIRELQGQLKSLPGNVVDVESKEAATS